MDDERPSPEPKTGATRGLSPAAILGGAIGISVVGHGVLVLAGLLFGVVAMEELSAHSDPSDRADAVSIDTTRFFIKVPKPETPPEPEAEPEPVQKGTIAPPPEAAPEPTPPKAKPKPAPGAIAKTDRNRASTRPRPKLAPKAAPKPEAEPKPDAPVAPSAPESIAPATKQGDAPARSAPGTEGPKSANAAPAAPVDGGSTQGKAGATGGGGANPKGTGGPQVGDKEGTVDRGALTKKYIRTVSRSVRKRYRYPRAAARAGLEGRVIVAVTIDASGRITAVDVVRSSGHAVLDKAAVATIRALGHFPAPPSALGWSKKRIKVPFNYKAEA